MIGIGATVAVTLLQAGIVKHLSDPPLPDFDSDKVNSSGTAYVLGVPGGAMSPASLAANISLAASAKSSVEALAAGWYFYQMPAGEKKWRAYCIVGAPANIGIAALALFEAKRSGKIQRANNMKIDELLKQSEAQPNESSISAADKNFANEAAAREVFAAIRAKIINVSEWNEHAFVSSYALFDERGKEIADEKIRVGAFLRINLKVPGKYDWVRVENIDDAADEFIIKVRPAFDPTAEKRDEKIISHFFTDESTNNFCLVRKGETVALYVIGLKEKQNTSETGGALETIRNIAVNFATYLGMQNSEWEKFCHHFMEDAANEK